MATEMICTKRVLIPGDIWFAEGIFRFNRLRRGAGDRKNRRSLRAQWDVRSRTYAGAAAVCWWSWGPSWSMKSIAAAGASLSEVAAALRETTETLACELATPTSESPLWSEFEWRIARAAAAMHGVSSLLCANLRWQGPASWRRFLEEQRDHTSRRHHKISGLLARIDMHARREGIVMVGLKGAALHAAGIYQAGERPMADIDLLVRPCDREATARVLESFDFSATANSRRHQTFAPRIHSATSSLGEHVDNEIKIELHTRIMEPLPIREVDITSFLLPRPMAAGLHGYRSAAALMSHLLLHAAGNMRARPTTDPVKRYRAARDAVRRQRLG